MNLRGLVDDTAEGRRERDLVDVIWFPTGGGKTEAYLGLAGWLMLFSSAEGSSKRWRVRSDAIARFGSYRAAVPACFFVDLRAGTDAARSPRTARR